MSVVLLIISRIMFVLMIITLIMTVKNNITWDRRAKVITALSKYLDVTIDEYFRTVEVPRDGLFLDRFMKLCYNKIESYNRTLFRFWDWGCKNIVPPYLYREIEKYL